MYYRLKLGFDAHHQPSGTWHTYSTEFGLRAVSRKHAINKGLRVIRNWPGYADREGHPDWYPVLATAEILEAQ